MLTSYIDGSVTDQLNPFSPHDALKHHSTSLKKDLIYLQLGVNFSPTPCHLHPLQAENCGSNSRLVVDKMTMVNSGLKGLKHTRAS